MDYRRRYESLLWDVRHIRNTCSGMADYCQSRGMEEQATVYGEITDELNRALEDDRARAEEQ